MPEPDRFTGTFREVFGSALVSCAVHDPLLVIFIEYIPVFSTGPKVSEPENGPVVESLVSS